MKHSSPDLAIGARSEKGDVLPTGEGQNHDTASHPHLSTGNASQHEWALHLVTTYDFHVFPVDHPELAVCAGPQSDTHDPLTCDQRGKHPAIKWKTGASTSIHNLTFWWSGNPRNIGIHCGKSGLFVIDEDKPGELARYCADNQVELPDTFTVKTAHGYHYYFNDTQNGALGNREGAFGDYAINIRSGTGYVVAPGSIHETGIVYSIHRNLDRADMPNWAVQAINGDNSNGHDFAHPNGATHEIAFQLPDVIKDHHRNNTLRNFASSMRAQSINYNMAKSMMEWAYLKCEQPPVAEAHFPLSEAIGVLNGVYNSYPPGRSEGFTRNDTNGHRTLKVTPLSEMAMKATRWLWEDNGTRWIPMNSIAGLAGREGVGKSTWSAHLAAQITRGTLPGDYYGKPKGVVIVTTEDDWHATIKPRLTAAGADLNKVYQVTAVDADGLEGTLVLPNDLNELERVILEHDVALVILDPLLTLVNAKLDTHKDAEVRRALEPVGKLAQSTRASFIGLIHVNKSTEGDLMNRIMGSRAIGAVVRSVLFCANYKPIEDTATENEDSPFFAPPEEPKRSRFVFGQIKNNLGPKVMHSHEYHIEGQVVGYDNEAQKDIEGSYLVTDRTIPENVEDIVIEQEKRRKAAKTGSGKAEAWLIGYLTGKGEVPSTQVIRDGDKAGHSRDAVYRARRKLDDRVQITNLPTVPKTSTWKLTEPTQ